MEAALRSLLQNAFGEYVAGLDGVEAWSFPLTLRDLKLREKKIQEDMEDENFPFDISGGRIGSVSVSPSLFGTVEVIATEVVLNFSFSPMKAMRAALRNGDDDSDSASELESQPNLHAPRGPPRGAPGREPAPPARQPPAPAAAQAPRAWQPLLGGGAAPPPRYCGQHRSSDRRPKAEPRMEECRACRQRFQTNYAAFALCPACSDRELRCMVCGAPAAPGEPARSPRAEGRGAPAPPAAVQGARLGSSPAESALPAPPPPPASAVGPRASQRGGPPPLPEPPPAGPRQPRPQHQQQQEPRLPAPPPAPRAQPRHAAPPGELHSAGGQPRELLRLDEDLPSPPPALASRRQPAGPSCSGGGRELSGSVLSRCTPRGLDLVGEASYPAVSAPGAACAPWPPRAPAAARF